MPRTELNPPRRNPFATKLRAIIEGRGLTQAEAARQIGVHKRDMERWLAGTLYPGREMAHRVFLWAFKGITFERAKRIKAYEGATFGRGTRWPQIRLHLPPKLVDRIRAKATKWHMTPAAFAHLAVERLLDDEPAITQLGLAARQVYVARLAQAVSEAPALRDFLKAELKLAVKIGAVRYAEDAVQAVSPVRAIEELALSAEGAPICELFAGDQDMGFEEDFADTDGD